MEKYDISTITKFLRPIKDADYFPTFFYILFKTAWNEARERVTERERKRRKIKIFSLLCQVSSKTLSRIIQALLLHNSCLRQLHRSYEKKLQKKKKAGFSFPKEE